MKSFTPQNSPMSLGGMMPFSPSINVWMRCRVGRALSKFSDLESEGPGTQAGSLNPQPKPAARVHTTELTLTLGMLPSHPCRLYPRSWRASEVKASLQSSGGPGVIADSAGIHSSVCLLKRCLITNFRGLIP